MSKEITGNSGMPEAAAGRAISGKEPVMKRSGNTPQEAVYTAGEFAANAGKLFRTRKECVMAAFAAAGRSECTISEAKRIVESFLRREVR